MQLFISVSCSSLRDEKHALTSFTASVSSHPVAFPFSSVSLPGRHSRPQLAARHLHSPVVAFAAFIHQTTAESADIVPLFCLIRSRRVLLQESFSTVSLLDSDSEK